MWQHCGRLSTGHSGQPALAKLAPVKLVCPIPEIVFWLSPVILLRTIAKLEVSIELWHNFSSRKRKEVRFWAMDAIFPPNLFDSQEEEEEKRWWGLGEPKTSGNQDVLKRSTNVHGLSYKKLDGMNFEYVIYKKWIHWILHHLWTSMHIPC